MVGLLWVTLPTDVNANNNSDAVTALANSDKIVWKVVNLDGTHEENKAKLDAVAIDEPYVRFVLQVDWQCPSFIYANGRHIIWDLNGHGLTFMGGVDIHFGDYGTDTVEITDSSAASNGYIDSYGPGIATMWSQPQCLLISGGKLSGYIQQSAATAIIVTGGCLQGKGRFPVINGVYRSLFIADYIVTDGDQYYRTGDNIQHAAFAISTSATYCGAYNYVYGVAWDLVAEDCILEKMTENVPYYLWYRASDREWYSLLLTL